MDDCDAILYSIPIIYPYVLALCKKTFLGFRCWYSVDTGYAYVDARELTETSIMFVANNLQDFRKLFAARLLEMLSADELGAFILAFANSLQDESTHSLLMGELERVYHSYADRSAESMLDTATDDVVVFDKLVQLGIENVPLWHYTEKSDWLQIVNPMRALRPPRASAQIVDKLYKVFDKAAFNFNKPFLKPEILWQGEFSIGAVRSECTVLFNKFPFLPYHFLLVPDAQACHPQYLSYTYHELVWDLCIVKQCEFDGIGFGYNSIGACASVNHLHFQGFIYDERLPVESRVWAHNGGEKPYPMWCDVFSDKQHCWEAIKELHESERAYNILYRPGRSYLFHRKMQGSSGITERMQGAGWIEECGVFAEDSFESVNGLSADDLYADIASLSV